jgi:hypothetical protein
LLVVQKVATKLDLEPVGMQEREFAIRRPENF